MRARKRCPPRERHASSTPVVVETNAGEVLGSGVAAALCGNSGTERTVQRSACPEGVVVSGRCWAETSRVTAAHSTSTANDAMRTAGTVRYDLAHCDVRAVISQRSSAALRRRRPSRRALAARASVGTARHCGLARSGGSLARAGSERTRSSDHGASRSRRVERSAARASRARARASCANTR